MLNTDVVYKIECKNYDAAHVDQIRRSRISKHRNHINIEDQRLVITEHRLEQALISSAIMLRY